MRDHRDEILGEIHHDLAGTVEAVAKIGLRPRRRLDLGMPVAEQHRPPAAHEIDVFAPVDVAHAAAFRGRKELRIAFRQPRRVEMPPHPAGHDALRPRAQHRVGSLRFAQHGCLFGHGLPLVSAYSARSTERY